MGKLLFNIIVLTILPIIVNAQPINIDIEDDGFWIREGKNKIFYYQRNEKSQDGDYARSHYLHPLIGLDGEVLTEDFPSDHPHHRGVFWAWHQLWLNGTKMGDPWLTEGFQQDVKNVNFYQSKNGTGIMETRVQWKSNNLSNCSDPKILVDELTKVTVYPKKGDYRRIDFRIELKGLQEGVRIGGSEDVKGYGGFSVRMKLADDMKFRDNHNIVKPQRTAIEAGRYIDISGPIGADGNNAGICIVDHPENPPHKWILRTKKSMQNCSYPGRECIELPTDKPVVLQYTLLVHRGNITDLNVNKILKDILEEKDMAVGN